ncbi:uncharacterized protein sS8_0851 [Methylocaldum marinum]|uniref:Transposase Helix-turn-helix domain-containing protein n=1 Tax=Methylocaldum marinum TaxID=1432792 RepID=A0A250KMF3_9GAMM|nr:transposase family protein [Methylocaldum marinum]BBA32722.1 uncharacterized protein sS8_0757 [Methylocaldum marinum]BBA32816.1 uncharacterized protein sS8_0851 [Methylocaldum marinum]
MVSYEDVKQKPRTLMAMTSLKASEFEELLVSFAATGDEETGRNLTKGGRPPIIASMADRLLFILFYLKTYPLQEVIAHLFGMSQPRANFTIHLLSRVLNKTLDARGHKPARLTEEMLSRLEQETRQDLGIDGTERRINRPVNDLGQRIHYSGKKNATP